MLASSVLPRTSTHTLATVFARYAAAWPAELPAPTTTIHPRAFEPRQTLDRQPPVLGAAGDDHGARRDPLPVADLDRIRLAIAGEPRGAPGDHHLRAELLRLRVRAPRQLLARDPRRKAEVVLDPRARAGLAAWRRRFHDQDVQSLRRPVHRRRESRGTRAHDDHVPDPRPIDRIVESEGVGDLLVGRVAEHEVAATDDYGDVADADAEPVEQLLGSGIAVQVHQGVGVPVAREEVADAEGPLAMARPEDHDVSDAARDQLHAPEDEGAHQ